MLWYMWCSTSKEGTLKEGHFLIWYIAWDFLFFLMFVGRSNVHWYVLFLFLLTYRDNNVWHWLLFLRLSWISKLLMFYFSFFPIFLRTLLFIFSSTLLSLLLTSPRRPAHCFWTARSHFWYIDYKSYVMTSDLFSFTITQIKSQLPIFKVSPLRDNMSSFLSRLLSLVKKLREFFLVLLDTGALVNGRLLSAGPWEAEGWGEGVRRGESDSVLTAGGLLSRATAVPRAIHWHLLFSL